MNRYSAPISFSLEQRRPVTNKYVLYPGNNSHLVGQALARRGWVEESDPRSSTHQFIWKPFSKGLVFDGRPFYGPLLTNHLEGHAEITEKGKLFRNLKLFCESKHKDVFNYVPITFEFHINSALYYIQSKKFYAFWNDLEEDGPAKELLPPGHFEGHNVWILKPTGFNRGRGIHVFNRIEKFDQLISDY